MTLGQRSLRRPVLPEAPWLCPRVEECAFSCGVWGVWGLYLSSAEALPPCVERKEPDSFLHFWTGFGSLFCALVTDELNKRVSSSWFPGVARDCYTEARQVLCWCLYFFMYIHFFNNFLLCHHTVYP